MLLQYIREEFAGVSVEPVIRKYWNEHAGVVKECFIRASVHSFIRLEFY